jgi:hypothetical protein
MVSQGAEPGVEFAGMVERGQASPREVESISVREGGHIGARPSISTCQRVGSGTIGTEDACVVGCDKK